MIINTYKPIGITSYDVIRILKFILHHPKLYSDISTWKDIIDNYQGGKIGHAGTLDPFAEGVLVVCTDQDTKKIPDIQSQPKEYQTIFKFGYISDTYDIDGIIKSVRATLAVAPSVGAIHELPLKNIKKFLNSHFTGEILQTPPAFSAKKINGKRAYELARAGKSVKLGRKKVVVYNIGVNKYDYPDLELIIICGSGTYIRSIAHDLGQLLHVGAYCHSLIRTKIGEYAIKNSLHLPENEIKYILNKKNA